MKIKLLFCLLFLIINLRSFSQQKTAVFDGGDEVNYEIVHNDPKYMNKLTMTLGAKMDGEGGTFTSLQYYKPEMFIIQSNIGVKHYEINGLIFFNSTTVDKPINLTLKNEYTGSNTITRKQVKESIKKRIDFGVHVGYTLKEVTSDGFASESVVGVSTHEIAVGFGRLKSRYISWLPEGAKKPIRGTIQVGVFADLLFYPSFSEGSGYNSTEPLKDEEFSKFGGRLYLDGRTSFVTNGDWGLMYRLGVGYGFAEKIYPLVGFGFYWGFRWVK